MKTRCGRSNGPVHAILSILFGGQGPRDRLCWGAKRAGPPRPRRSAVPRNLGATAMSPPSWLPDWLSPALELAPMQQFGLAFLLGSFTVATWSDLKRLCAQREFVEIWLLFALAMLGHDVWRAHGGDGDVSGLRVGVKWGLIVLASVLSLRPVGVLFRLAPADVAALAAAASLLTPGLVIL